MRPVEFGEALAPRVDGMLRLDRNLYRRVIKSRRRVARFWPANTSSHIFRNSAKSLRLLKLEDYSSKPCLKK